MSNIKSILKFAMRMEKDAEDFYSYYSEHALSNEIKELFRELAQIEKEHYAILERKFDELGLIEPPLTISWVVDSSFASKDPGILSGNSDEINSKIQEPSDLSVIRMAYLIENDFAEFYSNAAASVTDEQEKYFLTTIADWELKHKQIFYKRYQELLKKYWCDIASIIFNR